VRTRRSNIGWCSDGLEVTCWSRENVRDEFIIDVRVSGIILWHSVVNAGISGSHIRDMMLEAVERRLGTLKGTSPR
jgi:transposase InsO family protein